MILYVKSLTNNNTKRYILNDVEDFEEIFHLYPYTETIALKSDGPEDAANKIASYLSNSSRLDAWIEGNVMKSLKQNAALAIGLSAMPVSTGGRLLEQMPHNDVTEQEHNTEEFGKQPEDQFLWNIMQIESSGGKNTNHEEVKTGPMKGLRAIGRWGFMPPTVKNTLDRMKMNGKLTGDLRPLYTMNREQLGEHFEHNPTSELKLARFLARHVLKNNHGDQKRAAYSWLHGSNLTKDNIPEEELNGSDYVKQFKMWHHLNPYKGKELHVKKSLQKKESASEFQDRLKAWSTLRDYKTRKPLMRDNTYVPDPGRLREKELDEKKPTTDIKGLLSWAIKQAKKDNKKS